MWPFKKKKEKQKQEFSAIPELKHICVMKDMPWYMTTSYSGSDKTAEYDIIEPYICISGCGKRIDKVLEHKSWSNIDPKTREEFYDKIRKRYKQYLKPQAVVEDMINNILLVKDPGRLAMIEAMRGTPHRGCGTSATMQMPQKEQEPETDFRIKVEDFKK